METTLNISTQEMWKVSVTRMLRFPQGGAPGDGGINAQAHASHAQVSTHTHACTHTPNTLE